jgi:ADP-heptose synthase, bifunctional sugar kinase/adenylyltransferase
MLFNPNELFDNIKKLKVAVIGDYCLDQYWYMNSKHDIKLDYNDDITFSLTDINYYPGGAGNVVNNFIKLGIDVKCFGIIGDDGNGYQLLKCLKNIGANIDNILCIEDRETHTCIRPIRIINDKNIKLNEIITSKFIDTNKKTEDLIIKSIKDIIKDIDALVLIEQFDDNNKGVFTDNVRNEMNNLSLLYKNKIFIVDSRKYINKYENMFLKCNKNEFINTLSTDDDKEICIIELIKNLKNFKSIFVTCGSDGTTVINGKKCIEEISAIKIVDEINTCGAGDSATVGIVIGLYSNYDVNKSALLGNILASITIKDLHSTGYPTYEKIIETLKINQLI